MQTTSFETARQIVLEAAVAAGTHRIPLEQAAGCILAEDILAADNVPPFDRSPYDGYAFRAADTAQASEDHPVTLRILEEIPAGGVSHMPVTEGTAVKILTGAPVPPGADAVTMFEKTEFTDSTVKLFASARPGENIIYAGEDVKKGTVLAKAGTRIDAGLCGTLAAQNMAFPLVYRRPSAGIISTGSELTEIGEELKPGRIYNSNRYTLSAELTRLGFDAVYLGTAVDSVAEISGLILKGLAACDAVIITGGVSVGDYDLTEKAMTAAGVGILLHGVDIKPGMACVYGKKDGRLVCALSGNPASSQVNFHVIAVPALKKIMGLSEDKWLPEEFTAEMAEGFRKKSPVLRFLRGKLELKNGRVRMHPAKDQGNVVLSASIGMDAMAVIPAGSGPVEPGSMLKVFLLQ